MRTDRARSFFAAAAVFVLTAAPGRAAEITDVADAGDIITIGATQKEDMLDVYASSTFRMVLTNGKITREPINRAGVTSADCTSATARDCLPVDELRWKGATNILDFNMQLGVFHDLALTFGTHYVLSDNMRYRLAKDVSDSESSITNLGAQDLFVVPFESEHAGFGPLDLGIRFGALSDERDDSKPSWVIHFNWAAPWLGKTFNPNYIATAGGKDGNRATEKDPGPVSDGVHRLRFGMAFSKRVANFGLIGIDPNIARMGYVDPYFEVTYTLPVPQKSLTLTSMVPTKESEFGIRPSHEAEMNIGFEIVPVEDLKRGRKVAIDFGLHTTFCSEGRNAYNPFSGCATGVMVDPLAEPLYTEQFFVVNGLIGIYIQAAEYVRFKAGANLGFVTEHFLTFEQAGIDDKGDGEDDVSPTDSGDTLNPYFCTYNPDGDICTDAGQPSFDQIGLRFKDEEHVIFSWFASLMFTF